MPEDGGRQVCAPTDQRADRREFLVALPLILLLPRWERVALRSHYITPLQGRRGQKWWPLRQEGVRWGKAMDPSYFQPCTEHKDAQS